VPAAAAESSVKTVAAEEADQLNGLMRDRSGGEGSREEGERAWS
jgi:hypothetical protein